jgi:DnaA family protein
MPTRSESKPPASTAVNQLCLPLRLPGRGGFDAFVDDGNEDLVELLRRWAASPGTGDVLIHGEPGCGKSHLLHAAHEAATAAGASARFVALDLPALSPSVLEGLEDCDAVIIDAAHGVAGVRDWELALFNLYNALHHPGHATGGRLLLAARGPATALGFALPDLASRLSACASYALKPLDDRGRARLLRQEASRRGLTLDDATVGYILTHGQRQTPALLALLDELDRASLSLRRQPKPRLVGELLQGRLVVGDAPEAHERRGAGETKT